MMKRVAIGLLIIVLAVGVGAWAFRKELILFAVTNAGKKDDIAPFSPVNWAKWPNAPAGNGGGSGQLPNIIFILADDLGINDISTFGGGVVGGRITKWKGLQTIR